MSNLPTLLPLQSTTIEDRLPALGNRASGIIFANGRHYNWQSRLTQLLNLRANEPFNWSEFNCLIFGLEAIQAVYDVDLSYKFRAGQKTASGALKVLKKVANTNIAADVITKILDEPKDIAFARKGDLVFSSNLEAFEDNNGFGPVIGVCYGQISFFCGEYGLDKVLTKELEGCWHGFYS